MKPTHTPAKAAEITLFVAIPKRPDANIKPQATTRVTLDAKPSIPSVKLTAFVKPYINAKAIGQKIKPKPLVILTSPIKGNVVVFIPAKAKLQR